VKNVSVYAGLHYFITKAGGAQAFLVIFLVKIYIAVEKSLAKNYPQAEYLRIIALFDFYFSPFCLSTIA
jgi:hypothetical protein